MNLPLIAELKRRNVFRVAAAYGVVAWLLIQVSTTVLPLFGAPDWIARVLVVILAIGLVPTLFWAWVFELTSEGLKTQEEADAAGLSSRLSGPRPKLALAVLLVAAASLFLLGRYSGQAGATMGTAAYALLGDREKAHASLARTLAIGRFTHLSGLDVDILRSGLRDDPRYETTVAPARARAAGQVRLAQAAGLLE